MARNPSRELIIAAHNKVKRMAAALKQTQAWKYSDLVIFLNAIKEDYEFEYVIPFTPVIYDLCLFSRRILIEFDGMSHNNKEARSIDRDKEEIAEDHGFELVRIPVQSNVVIPAETILEVLNQYSKLPGSRQTHRDIV